MAERKEPAAARITDQFRSRGAMVYDLSCAGVHLTISLAPAADGEEETVSEWRAEAHARQATERPTVVGTGATRGEAVSDVARAWTAKNGAWGFPTLDWEAVAQALHAVRAT
jgi:hypothetical protein